MNRKIEIAKKKQALRAEKTKLLQDSIKASKDLKNAVEQLYVLLNDKNDYDYGLLEKQLIAIDKKLDLKPYFTNLERSIEKNSPLTHIQKTKIQDFSKLLDAVKQNKPIKTEIDLNKLEKAVVNIEQYIRENSEPSDQGAENYQPVRRVIKIGNRFIFDDNFTNAGGGGNSGDSNGLTDAQLRATPVPVSGTVTANLGTLNGAATAANQQTDALTDTELRATPVVVDLGANNDVTVTGTVTANLGTLNGAATAANQQTDALTDTELRATPVPVSGTVTATPTGTQNVDVTANTIGLATAANQLPDGHNVTVDNGIGAAAVPIQDGGNSITVDGTVAATQSGTWTEANSAAIKTAVETIDNAISGSEMQVDVVAALPAGTNNIGDVDVLSLPALPAGTNAIGKLSANSGVDIGDVDVTSSVSSTLDHGSNLDIDTTAEQITSTSFACKFGVTLRADVTNTGTLYIGNSDVTVSGTAATDGIPLGPGDSLFLPVTNSNIPYAIASANNQKIYWVAV